MGDWRRCSVTPTAVTMSPSREKGAGGSRGRRGGGLRTHEGRTSRRQRDYVGEVMSTLITGVLMRSNGMKLRK